MGRKAGNSAVLEPPKQTDDPVSMLASKGKSCPELSPADFWKATKAYPQGAGTFYKLYRLFPVIDRRLTGHEKKDIANVPAMDSQWVLDNFGCGHYQIFFNDANGRPVSLAKCTLELDRDFWEHPPVLDQRELVEGHPKNKGYIEGLQARGLWQRDAQQQEQNNMAEAAAASAANTAVQEISGIAKTAIARSSEKQPADEAAAASVRIMETGFNAALKSIAESGGNKGNSGEMMLVVQMMQEQQQRQHEIFMEMLKQQGARQNPAAASTIDKEISVVQKMMEFAKTLAADGGGRSSSWMDRLPDIAVPLIAGMMQRAAAPPAMPPQYAPPASYPVSLPVAGVPAAAAPPVAPVQSAPPAAPEVDDAMMPMILANMGVPPEAIPFAVALIKNNIAGRAVQMFRGGVSGYAFAAEVERTEGEDTYGLVHGAGLAGLVGVLTRFAPMLGPENAAMISSPQFQAWLGDFFAYGDQAGYADDESDAEPAGTDAGVAE